MNFKIIFVISTLCLLSNAGFLEIKTPSVPIHENTFVFLDGFFYGMSVQLDKPDISKCINFSVDAKKDFNQAVELLHQGDIHWLKYFGQFISVIPDVQEFCKQTLEDAQIMEELVENFSSFKKFKNQVGLNALANAFNLYWITAEGKEAVRNQDTEQIGFALGRAFAALLLQDVKSPYEK